VVKDGKKKQKQLNFRAIKNRIIMANFLMVLIREKLE
jgi:hypothetical protein